MTKIYAFVFVCIIFSCFTQTETQCIHLCLYKVREVSESGERDLESGKRDLEDGNENKYIYTIFSHFVCILYI